MPNRPISVRPAVLTDGVEESPTCGRDSSDPRTVLDIEPFFYFCDGFKFFPPYDSLKRRASSDVFQGVGLESDRCNLTSFHKKVNMEELPSHGVKRPFSTITLSLRPFHDKMVTFPNAESKGENIGPKGAVQAPLT